MLTQPQLVDSILWDLHFQDNTKEKKNSALTSVILQKDTDGKPFGQEYLYWIVIGKLNFFGKIDVTRHFICIASMCSLF